MPRSTGQAAKRQAANTNPREAGLRAFQSGRFAQAIQAWTPLAANDAALQTALAEAHFRRALGSESPDALADLRRAQTLAPSEPRYQFHLGRLLHQAGELAGAAAQYRALLAQQPNHAAAARLLALVSLEQHPHAELNLPELNPAALAWAAPAQAVLRDKLPQTDDEPIGRFWRGLGLVAARDAAASELLADERSLPAPALHALRRYYRGVAAARTGDLPAALKLWQQVYQSGGTARRLEENLAALLHAELERLFEAGDEAGAAALALQWAALAGAPAFDELRLQALDGGARTAATSGNWAQAAAFWEAARQILTRSPKLGSPQPLLHNLALAYERQEAWEQAAEAWRALLRTRKRGEANDGPEAARWAWVRRRIISCYRNADRPDEAVTVFRQAVKAEPNDLDLRLQLADALMANDQERAAHNEIKRILQIDPHYPEALLRQASHLTDRYEHAEAEQIARDVAARHPDRPDLLRAVAELFMEHGRQLSQWGRYDKAFAAFVEGERYQPDNPRFPLNQARMLIMQRKPGDTAGLIERALSVNGEALETWVLAVETWAMADNIEGARGLLARFEQERQPDADAYMSFGTNLLERATPPPPFALFGVAPPPPPPTDTPWTALAIELIEKAVALRSNDQRFLMAVASFLLLPRSKLARRFADMAVKLAPDEPDALIVLGLAQALNDEVAAAKATLQRAGQVARRAGRRDVQEQAQELRRVVGTPMLRSMLQMGMSGDLDDLDFFDEDVF